ncbi:hypothetical protein CONPUDRAFT_161835 [Coniophora puteana RWD-64-598 SS2]|uniref:Uncharacterized protein n=1 Tax=Coniophora puteana (strain RWD-64-598) TaxID=741705 RepID=A0A5M3N725_CONPW|nr:uncharacterized protein CONPUDRAFT_161835 [Coniophora puteana RWD-64-598 SS2]EIW87250.1 hypothetical protein CONPUDRAFT_161835 [Coniophora puteana RWD-64-598 SS2]
MTSRQKSVSELSADPKMAHLMDNKASVWANKPNHGFPVTDVRTDRAEWVRDWDKGVEKLSKRLAMDVFLKMISGREDDDAYLSIELSRSDHDTLRQNKYRFGFNHTSLAHHVKASLSNPALALCTPKDWFTLITPEQRRDALNKGIEDACWSSCLGQDSRALCPEIISTALLKRKGLALFDFYDCYIAMALSAEEDPLKKDMVDSERWCRARFMVKDMDVEPQCMHENFEYVFELYTCYRQDFLDQFVQHSLMAIMKACGKHVTQNETPISRLILNTGARGLQELQDTRKEVNHRLSPLCEYCDLSPDEVSENSRFLVCGACKRQLNFEHYYCSKCVSLLFPLLVQTFDFRECQRLDWPQHKLDCGKTKNSKNRNEGVPEYKHSLASILQLSTRSKYPKADYLLFKMDDVWAFAATFLHDKAKRALFREKRALVTIGADRDGLDIVAKCLVEAVVDWSHSSKFKLTRESVIRQLSEEYEVDVKTCLEALEANLAASGDASRYKGMTIVLLPGKMVKLTK